MNVYDSNRQVAVDAVITALVQGTFFGLTMTYGPFADERDASVLGAVVAGTVFGVWMAGVWLWQLHVAREEHRAAIGSRFDRDRAALGASLRSGELPADESLDAALLAAVAVEQRQKRTGWAVPRWVAGVVVAAGLLALAVVISPWVLLTFALVPYGVWKARRNRGRLPQDERYAALREAVEARLRVAGDLTLHDLHA